MGYDIAEPPGPVIARPEKRTIRTSYRSPGPWPVAAGPVNLLVMPRRRASGGPVGGIGGEAFREA